MNIAIAGYGVEGVASFNYWNTPGNRIAIVDERESVTNLPAGIETILGVDAFSRLDDFDLIIRSPSVSPNKLPYEGKVWSATNEFFDKCPAAIIGVTGTKGKGTTCSLITSILRAAGHNVHLVGNIGTPALTELSNVQPSDIIVYELSSFQLWDLEKSPHVSVVLMIEPDHLDDHATMEDYVEAKARIASHQTENDVVIYNQNNAYARQIAEQSQARKVSYPFAITEFVSSLKLLGKHNQENASAAIAAAREFSVSDDEIRQGLATFDGLPHRLEKVRELDGVTYYNDSFSSAPGATVAAIRSFDMPEIVIIGGIDKGADFQELGETLSGSAQVKTIILIGEIRHKLAERFSSSNAKIVVSDARTMTEVVGEARKHAVPGDIVLLSPACASFDMFKNFYDRGDQFRSIVNAI